MKKVLFIFVLLLFTNSSFANENLVIKSDNPIIDTTSTWYVYELLDKSVIWWKFSLYKLNYPDNVLVENHQYSILIKWPNSRDETKLLLDKKPAILNYLVNKIWEFKIKKYLDNGILNIIWYNNKTQSSSYKDTSKYYFNWDNKTIEAKYFDVYDKYIINNKENTKKTKIVLNPFNKEYFMWNINLFEAVWPYPTFSIYDNSLLPQNIFITVHKVDKEAYKINKSTPRSIYYPKVIYTLQKYKIFTSNTIETEKQTETKITSVFIPSYEFEIEIPEWESILELTYLKPYFDKDNEGVTIYWNN
jgi:hypothetical protein